MYVYFYSLSGSNLPVIKRIIVSIHVRVSRYDAFTAILMILSFWDVTPCLVLNSYRRLEGVRCFRNVDTQ